jgi:hypothetical protein
MTAKQFATKNETQPAAGAGRERVFVVGGALGQGAGGVYLATWLLFQELNNLRFAVTCFASSVNWEGSTPVYEFKLVTPWVRRGSRWDLPNRCLSRQVRQQYFRERPFLILVLGLTHVAAKIGGDKNCGDGEPDGWLARRKGIKGPDSKLSARQSSAFVAVKGGELLGKFGQEVTSLRGPSAAGTKRRVGISKRLFLLTARMIALSCRAFGLLRLKIRVGERELDQTKRYDRTRCRSTCASAIRRARSKRSELAPSPAILRASASTSAACFSSARTETLKP